MKYLIAYAVCFIYFAGTTWSAEPSASHSSYNATKGRPAVIIRKVGDKNLYYDGNNSTITAINSTANLSKADERRHIKVNNDTSRNKEDSNSNWSLQFDPSYFATLNAMNHRPTKSDGSTETNTKSTSYYTPESYGKSSHKNHKNYGFSYKFPSGDSASDVSVERPSLETYDKVHRYSAALDDGANITLKKLPTTERPGFYDDGPIDETDDMYELIDDNGKNSKYYYPQVNPKSRAKPKPGRPIWYSDMSPSSASSGDYTEDYEPSDGYPDLKNYAGGTKNVLGGSHHSYSSGSNYYPFYPDGYAGHHSHLMGPDGIHRYSASKGNHNFHSISGLTGFLLGLIPLGILMASLVPAFVSVPVATAAAGAGRRRRNVKSDPLSPFLKSFLKSETIMNSNPVIELISKYGDSFIGNQECLKYILCKIALETKREDTDTLQRLFLNILERIPENLAATYKLDGLVKSIKTNSCQFNCNINNNKYT